MDHLAASSSGNKPSNTDSTRDHSAAGAALATRRLPYLPPRIRVQIAAFAVISNTQPVPLCRKRRKLQRRQAAPAVLTVNKEFYYAGIKVYYRCNQFLLRSIRSLNKFFCRH